MSNMNLLLRPLALIASLLLTSSAFAVDVSYDGNGRYQAVAATNTDKQGLWVIDTKTGESKYCQTQVVQGLGIQVYCWKSKDVKE